MSRPPMQLDLSNIDDFADVNDKFDILERIGEGTFSIVWLAQSKENGERYALKRISRISSPVRVLNEVTQLQLLGGQGHVVDLVDHFRVNDFVTLVLPYFKHQHFKEYYLDMDVLDTQQYMRALFESLAHLCKHNVIHRDIKPSNFLHWFGEQRGNGPYLLVDFGLAQDQTLSHETIDQLRLQRKASLLSPTPTLSPIKANSKTSISKQTVKEEAENYDVPGTPQRMKRLRSNTSSGSKSNRKQPLAINIPVQANLSDVSLSSAQQSPLNLPGSVASFPQSSPVNFSMVQQSPHSYPYAVVETFPPISAATTPSSSASSYSLQQTIDPMLQMQMANAANCGPAVTREDPTVYEPSSMLLETGLATSGNRDIDIENVNNYNAKHPVAISSSPVLPFANPSIVSTPSTQVMTHVYKKKPKIPAAARAGTRGFRAPEVLLQLQHQTCAIDMWSAGVMLLCILSRFYPFFNAPDDTSALGELAVLFGVRKDNKETSSSLKKKKHNNATDVRNTGLDCSILTEGTLFMEQTLAGTKVTRDIHLHNFPANHKFFAYAADVKRTSQSSSSSMIDIICSRGGMVWPSEALDLLHGCLNPDPLLRLTPEEALKMPFFTTSKKLKFVDVEGEREVKNEMQTETSEIRKTSGGHKRKHRDVTLSNETHKKTFIPVQDIVPEVDVNANSDNDSDDEMKSPSPSVVNDDEISPNENKNVDAIKNCGNSPSVLSRISRSTMLANKIKSPLQKVKKRQSKRKKH